MKSAYVICALLGLIIGSLVLADNGATLRTNEAQTPKPILSTITQDQTKHIDKKEINTTTPVPSNNITSTSTSTTVPMNVSTTATPSTTIPSITTKVTIITPTTVIPNTTSPIPTTPSTISTTPKNITTTSLPVTSTTASTVHTSTPQSQTTAVPTTPSSSKDRRFDGLSFFGGIILTTCLMAIAAFSWKFYRQCNEGNYRTL